MTSSIASFGPVRLIQDGPIAVIEIDNPPVNATSQAVRAGLLAAVEAVDADPAFKAAVIAAAGRTFVAGGDISEFGKPPQLPHLPDVVNRIEAMAKPVVVAWHGTALGGGCEIGLAAHARVITRDGSLGLPEVKLGLCPGAGGTQRLPRLVGVAAAIDIIGSGRMVPAREAQALGLVDVLAEGDARAAAVAHARAMIGSPIRRTGERPLPVASDEAVSAAITTVTKDKRRLAPAAIVDLVRRSARLPVAEGMPVERTAGGSL